MLVHLLVLNYNGRRRLAECLPSVLCAAACSRHACQTAVIDNASTDDSVAWLGEHFPQVDVIRRPNRGLCSFNDVVPGLEGPVALLLNNDVSLHPHCIDPLVAPLTRQQPRDESPCFMTAPLCWRPDGSTYEGLKTAVCWRFGLVRATALFPGHEATIRQPGLTASAGAALAVDCRKFAELGGFDPLYLPGRLEDLDFAFRGYLAGYCARYVPQSVMFHRGMATFGEVFGREGCDRLALRNTLLFQWKNLRHPLHLARQLFALPARLALDVVRAPWLPATRRWMFARALFGALARLGQLRSTAYRADGKVAGEREFFRRFHPRRMAEVSSQSASGRIRARLLIGQTRSDRSPIACTQRRSAIAGTQCRSAIAGTQCRSAIAGTQCVPGSSPGDVVPRLLAASGAIASGNCQIEPDKPPPAAAPV